jgi:hypothetical protein
MVNTLEPVSELTAPALEAPDPVAIEWRSAPAGTAPRAEANLSPSDCLLLQTAASLAPDDTSAVDTVMATAYIANVNAGTMKLQTTQEKWFLGLLTRTVLRVVPAASGSTWHRGSLEASLCQCGSISDTIYDWLGEDSRNPRLEALRMMRQRLIGRRLLHEEVRRRRVLWLFNVSTYTYQPLVLPTDRVELVKEFHRTDPAQHLQLMTEIGHGFGSRTLVDNYD